MSKNNFKVKKIKDSDITLEEIKDNKHPFIIFWHKYGNIIYLTCMILAFTTFTIGIGLTISNLANTSKIQVLTTGTGLSITDNNDSSDIRTDEISIMNATPITEEFAKRMFTSKINPLELKDGVIIELNRISITNGTVIYFSDLTSLIIYNDKTIKRIGPTNNSYGVDNNGNILTGAVVKTVNEVTYPNYVKDDLIITYLSDNTAIINKNNYYILIRNISELSVSNENINNPYTVSVINNISDNTTYYTDGLIKTVKNNITYLTRNNNIDYATVLRVEELSNSTLVYYTDGSIEIVTNGNSVMVRKGCYVTKTNNVVEININNNKIDKVSEKTIGNYRVHYFNNGIGIIEYSNGVYRYVEENSIIDTNLDNITGINNADTKQLPSGNIVINFSNGLSFVKNTDTTGFLIKTTDIIYDSEGNIFRKEITSTDFINVKTLTVSNNSDKKINYKVTIEETNLNNYSNIYSIQRLNSNYIKYQLLVNSNYINPKTMTLSWSPGYSLAGGLKVENNTYILYEGQLESLDVDTLSLSLWLDYDSIDNSMMNRAFIGTIKVYSEEQNS